MTLRIPAIALLLLAFLLRGQFFTMHDGIVFGLLVFAGGSFLAAAADTPTIALFISVLPFLTP